MQRMPLVYKNLNYWYIDYPYTFHQTKDPCTYALFPRILLHNNICLRQSGLIDCSPIPHIQLKIHNVIPFPLHDRALVF